MLRSGAMTTRSQKTGSKKDEDMEKDRLRAVTEEMWKERWKCSDSGRWTYRWIPDIRSWWESGLSRPCFHTTQAITGHGCFRTYLRRIRKAQIQNCWFEYSALNDTTLVTDAEYMIFHCDRWEGGGGGRYKPHIGGMGTPFPREACGLEGVWGVLWGGSL